MNGLISYLPESEVAVARLYLFSPTTGGAGGCHPPAPRPVRLCLNAQITLHWFLFAFFLKGEISTKCDLIKL